MIRDGNTEAGAASGAPRRDAASVVAEPDRPAVPLRFAAPSMRELVPVLVAWQADGQRCALATVVRVYGRAPLPVGASLIVAEDGATAGAVSGGCVEQEVIRAAREVMAGGPARRLTFAPDADGVLGLGLPCGGGIDVWVQAWDAVEPEGAFEPEPRAGARGLGPGGPAVERMGGAEPGPRAGSVGLGPGGPAVERTGGAEPGRRAGARGLGPGGPAVGQLGGAEARAAFTAAVLAGEPAQFCTALEEPGESFALVVDPMPRLVLVGAGLVAGALCGMAEGLGWSPIVIDPRTVIAAHAPIQDAARLVLAWPDEAVAGLGSLGPGDAIVVLSHQPALDDAALRVAVTTGAGFIGALGSRRAHADRLARLRDHGMSEDELARIVGPVGLDLGGWSPAEIAVSIVAELIAARHGRAGGRLAATDGPIHGSAGPADGPVRSAEGGVGEGGRGLGPTGPAVGPVRGAEGVAGEGSRGLGPARSADSPVHGVESAGVRRAAPASAVARSSARAWI